MKNQYAHKRIMQLDISLGKLEHLLANLQSSQEHFMNYYYEINDIDLSIMEYCKNEPEFYEFMYVDSVYHYLKLFK